MSRGVCVQLGDLISPAKVARAGNSEYPILSMTMHEGLVDQEKKFKKRIASADTSPYKVVKNNQLVVGFPIDEGVLSFQRLYPFGIVSPAYDVWDLKDEKQVDSRYLERFLRSPQAMSFYATKLRGTTARRRTLPDETFLSLSVPLPSITEQLRITTILDHADALRVKRRAALTQLDSLTQSLFLDLFGDPATNPKGFPKVPLDSLVRDDDTINYGVVQPGNDLDEGVPLVRVGDLIEEKVRHSNLKRIAPSIEAAYKRSRLRGNEVLLVCVGATAGLVAIADETVTGFNIARAIARIPVAEGSLPVFIASYLRTDWTQRHFQSELRTVAQPTLNIKQICELPVVHPPITLQREFARRVSAVEALKSAQRASLAELDALFASLQHRAFRGELV